jgi:uncharacterized membrane protein (UPF0127 family)
MVGKWLALGLAVALLLFAWGAWPQIRHGLMTDQPVELTNSQGYGRATVFFSDRSVEALIPLTAELQSQGLGGRTSLSDHQGMLWIYSQPTNVTFWMKGMTIPIDIIWLRSHEVVGIEASVPPPNPGQLTLPTYRPNQPVDAVLEVAAGFAERYGISPGATVTIDRH